ncbi:MAG: hypothetical protein RI985_541 [Chloroflexota bacterium]|jgi:2-oxoglutarate dehydrogenase E1 component
MRVIDDVDAQQRAEQVQRLILCTGKVYVDVVTSIAPEQMNNVAVVRIEELYSFPAADVQKVLSRYPNVQEVVWLQEEPKNMGAWSYVAPRIKSLLPADMLFVYVGRAESASPAEGSQSDHAEEQQRIIQHAVLQPIGASDAVVA